MPPRTVAVPLVLMSLPQAIEIQENVCDDGQKVAQLLVNWPMTTVMIEVDKDAGLAIADKMREIFGPGLHIAHDLPPNGVRP